MSEKRTKPVGPMYAILYPFLAMRARECGYALALHGSLATDLDLVAVPWVENATSAEDLVAHLLKYREGELELLDSDTKNGVEGLKPHGRRVWTIHVQAWIGAYIDLSVMPRQTLLAHGADVDG